MDELSTQAETVIVRYLERLPLRGKFGAMMATERYPELAVLDPFVDYQGERVMAVRKTVDHLDNVTVWWR